MKGFCVLLERGFGLPHTYRYTVKRPAIFRGLSAPEHAVCEGPRVLWVRVAGRPSELISPVPVNTLHPHVLASSWPHARFSFGGRLEDGDAVEVRIERATQVLAWFQITASE